MINSEYRICKNNLSYFIENYVNMAVYREKYLGFKIYRYEFSELYFAGGTYAEITEQNYVNDENEQLILGHDYLLYRFKTQKFNMDKFLWEDLKKLKFACWVWKRKFGGTTEFISEKEMAL